MKKVRTRTKYKIVGSDYSGQELRVATFLSKDPILLKSYAEDKDVYAMIASMIFNIPYEDCLEFYPEGTELEIDGKKIIAGNDKEYIIETDTNNSIIVPYFYLINNGNKDIQANEFKIGDKIKSDIGLLEIKNIEKQDKKIKFVF